MELVVAIGFLVSIASGQDLDSIIAKLKTEKSISEYNSYTFQSYYVIKAKIEKSETYIKDCNYIINSVTGNNNGEYVESRIDKCEHLDDEIRKYGEYVVESCSNLFNVLDIATEEVDVRTKSEFDRRIDHAYQLYAEAILTLDTYFNLAHTSEHLRYYRTWFVIGFAYGTIDFWLQESREEQIGRPGCQNQDRNTKLQKSDWVCYEEQRRQRQQRRY